MGLSILYGWFTSRRILIIHKRDLSIAVPLRVAGKIIIINNNNATTPRASRSQLRMLNLNLNECINCSTPLRSVHLYLGATLQPNSNPSRFALDLLVFAQFFMRLNICINIQHIEKCKEN